MAATTKPTKAQIDEVAKTLKPGSQKALGGGIYLRRDGQGRLRYQLRIRMAGRGSRHLGGTYESWTEADRERRRLVALKENGNRPAPPAQRAGTPFECFATEDWWEGHVRLHCDELTVLDYGSFLERDVLPYWSGHTLGSITRQHGRDYQRWLMTVKVHKRGTRKGQLAVTGVDRAMSIFNRILNYAVDEGVLELNPCRGITALSSSGARRGPKVKRVDRRQIFTPTEIERIRLAFAGGHEWAYRCRALVSVLAYLGLRPCEAIALRHGDWRTRTDVRTHMTVDDAVKDVAGPLVLGPTKTREPRDVFLWQIVAEELEALYQIQGCPPLDSLVFPGATGRLFRFANWRHRSWYSALIRAGISSKATGAETEPAAPTDPGAREPYAMRHTCATLMLYASKPNGGHYTPHEIGRQLGHAATMTLAVYGHVMDDDSEIAGKTIDQAIREARRTVWGPQPGDADFVDDELSTVQVAKLTRLSIKAVNSRISCGNLRAKKRNGRYVIKRAELARAGLILEQKVAEAPAPESLAADARTAEPQTSRRVGKARSRRTAIRRIPPVLLPAV